MGDPGQHRYLKDASDLMRSFGPPSLALLLSLGADPRRFAFTNAPLGQGPGFWGRLLGSPSMAWSLFGLPNAARVSELL